MYNQLLVAFKIANSYGQKLKKWVKKWKMKKS